MKLPTLGAAVVGCLLAASASAAAAGTERVVVAQFAGEPYEFTIDCSPYGAYDFDIAVSGRQHGRITDVYDRDGTLLRTVFQIGFSETDTNTLTQASLPLRGSAHDVLDYATNTRTLSGNVAIGTRPGTGTYFQETGRISLDLATREALFVAGRHDAFLAGGLDRALCAAQAAVAG